MDEKKNATAAMALSMAIFGTIGIVRNFISLSSGMLAMIRGILGATVLVLWMVIRHLKPTEKVSAKVWISLAFIGGLIGFNWLFLFEAYNYTTVATATLCYYMQPAIVMALSPIVFREKMTVKKGICLLCAMVGMLLVSGVLTAEEAGGENWKGIAFGLAAAALYSSIVILSKKIFMPNAYFRTAVQLISASAVMLLYVLFTEDFSAISLTGTEVILTVIVGVVHTGIAYCLYFGSIVQIPAQSAAILSYIDPVVAVILSVLILGEPLTVSVVAGSALILGSAFVSELQFFTDKGGKTENDSAAKQ